MLQLTWYGKHLGLGVLATALMIRADAATAATYNYIPSVIQLLSVKQTASKLCVIGSSQQKKSIPAYYFAKSTTAAKQGVWQLATNAPTETVNGKQVQYFTALELGSDVQSLVTSPSVAQPYVNAGALRFYAVPSSVNCASIQYTFSNAAAGNTNVSFYPYPSGLLEMSAYPVANSPNTGDTSQVLTIDTSNVDSFQIPIMTTFAKTSTISPATVLGFIGNPVASPLISRRTMIAGASGTGGAKSPFVTWLQAQAGPALSFQNLALSSAGWTPSNPAQSKSGSWPYASIQSPQDFLVAQCTKIGTTNFYFVPAQCNLNAQRLNWTDPLNTFYDAELKSFYASALTTVGGKQRALVVMGDASSIGAKATWVPQSSWTVTTNKASCPIYLKPDGASLRLTATAAYKTPIIICNPVGQVVQMAGVPVAVTQAAGSPTATVQISQTQYGVASTKVGWNFGQPETGWIGNITKVYQQNANYYMDLNILVASPKSKPSTQTLCTSSCATSNGAFKIWLFSNLQWGNVVNPFETASQMVFANDGAFNSWSYYTEVNLATVTQSIERNIVWAFAHGIANCNNVTMADPATRPTTCAQVKPLASDAYEAYAAAASDAYWVNEANWYPKNGLQNYYAQYLHTARGDKNGAVVVPGATCGKDDPCPNMFFGANYSIPNGRPALSNQRVPMGMAYGFGYDETPDYLVAKPTNVPSKLDPIPSGWGTVYVKAIIGNVE